MKELKIKHTFRFVPLIFLILTSILFLAPRLALGWWSNQASLMLLQVGVDFPPEQSPILAIGIRPPKSQMEMKLLFIESHALKTDLFNVHRVGAGLAPAQTLERSKYSNLTALTSFLSTSLERILSYSPHNQAILMKLARLELLSRRYEPALAYLVELERESICAHLNAKELNCYPLWMAIGDALDGMGQPEEALTYYRAINWVGRQEAASFLALQLAEEAKSNGYESDAQGWIELASEILPDTLATLYASDPQQSVLRKLDNPNTLLALRTDPRLERLNAEATVGLLRAGVWDKQMFHRILAARAWAVDTHTFDYGEFRKVWVWTANVPNITARTDALIAYFERLVELVPEDGYAWFYFAEAKARLGECEANEVLPSDEARLYYERALEADAGLSVPVSRCEEIKSPDLPISSSSQPILTIEMEEWLSYGHAIRWAAAPSHQYGYERHATWLWGPDKLYHTQGQAAFRADCLWHEGSSEPTFLALTLTDERGQIDYQTVPANHELEVSYWWKATHEAQLTPLWMDIRDKSLANISRSDTVYEEDGWIWTTLTTSSKGRGSHEDRTFELRWQVTGCGQLWLDHITVSIMRR